MLCTHMAVPCTHKVIPYTYKVITRRENMRMSIVYKERTMKCLVSKKSMIDMVSRLKGANVDKVYVYQGECLDKVYKLSKRENGYDVQLNKVRTSRRFLFTKRENIYRCTLIFL